MLFVSRFINILLSIPFMGLVKSTVVGTNPQWLTLLINWVDCHPLIISFMPIIIVSIQTICLIDQHSHIDNYQNLPQRAQPQLMIAAIFYPAMMVLYLIYFPKWLWIFPLLYVGSRYLPQLPKKWVRFMEDFCMLVGEGFCKAVLLYPLLKIFM
jgi:hypothetical protein